jgi:DNA-binding transcriptional regulator YdaS (Cro superfamily)
MNADAIEQLNAWLITHGQRRLAHACGVTYQSVQGWMRRKQIPARHVLKVEALTGIPRDALAPDVFGLTPTARVA